MISFGKRVNQSPQLIKVFIYILFSSIDNLSYGLGLPILSPDVGGIVFTTASPSKFLYLPLLRCFRNSQKVPVFETIRKIYIR